MADIDHGDAGFVAQPHEIGQDFLLAFFIQRSQRLIQQQQPRFRQQRAPSATRWRSPPDSFPGRRSSRSPISSRTVTAVLCAIPGKAFIRRP